MGCKMKCVEREAFVMATLHLVLQYLCIGTVVDSEGEKLNVVVW